MKVPTSLKGIFKKVPFIRVRRMLSCGYLLLLTSGCASYGVIENTAIPEQSEKASTQEYSLMSIVENDKSNDIFLALSFSGGGTRAAAMAYGIMLELRDTNAMLSQGSTRLLDEIDAISSVSGGSFTAAYYGLHGEGMFDTYEDVFLRKNVEKPMLYSLLNPLHWFSKKGRTERSVEYYDKTIFHGATYADMLYPGRPLILINTSDLAYGVRFTFVQEYFNLLCSDLLSFPVSMAVTASSAVPVAFNPIIVKNHSGCIDHNPEMVKKVRDRAIAEDNLELGTLLKGLESYQDKEQRKYIHFVDGGITDNIGLRAYYDIFELVGGPKYFLEKAKKKKGSKRLVLISVDASTTPVYDMGTTNKQPSMIDSARAMSGIQLHRYNAASIDLVQTALHQWAKELSTPESSVTPYFIEVSFEDVKDSLAKQFLNMIPTSFFLEDNEVEKIIETGRQLLRNNPDFQQLLTDIKNS